MASGFAHIIALAVAEDSAGIRVPQYQFTYNDGGNSYARTFDEFHLIEFLKGDLGLFPDIADRILTDVRTIGNATVRDVHIPETEAAAMGLMQVGSDF